MLEQYLYPSIILIEKRIMKIECPNCPQVYNIPKERFPEGKKKIAFPCPACKATIRVDLSKNDANEHELDRSIESSTDSAEKKVSDGQELKKR
jgi:predicted RNA-binding Zn-ribbon protein involved in translation (DUF1610 family)